MIDRKLVAALKQFDPEKLGRSSELGVHFNFDRSVPILRSYFEYLNEIVDAESNQLSDSEVKRVESSIRKLMVLRQKILDFNPKEKDNAATYQDLNLEIQGAWQNESVELRPIYNFLKIKSFNFDSKLNNVDDAVTRINGLLQQFESKRREVEQLPLETQNKFNEAYGDIQKRLLNSESELRTNLREIQDKYNLSIQKLRDDSASKVASTEKRIQSLTEEANTKIDEVLQQAKKFSAKQALSTYSQIFMDEAESVNKPAIRRWERTLFVLILIEIATALSLFFYFLPEVLQISQRFNVGGINSTMNIGLLLTILFVKIFILSVIAVAISYTVKSLNAQNHLYSINKFKANSLGSFQAFLDATDNVAVIDQIIHQVATAVYSQTVSGYLSKDDSAIKYVDPDTANLASSIAKGFLK